MPCSECSGSPVAARSKNIQSHAARRARRRPAPRDRAGPTPPRPPTRAPAARPRGAAARRSRAIRAPSTRCAAGAPRRAAPRRRARGTARRSRPARPPARAAGGSGAAPRTARRPRPSRAPARDGTRASRALRAPATRAQDRARPQVPPSGASSGRDDDRERVRGRRAVGAEVRELAARELLTPYERPGRVVAKRSAPVDEPRRERQAERGRDRGHRRQSTTNRLRHVAALTSASNSVVRPAGSAAGEARAAAPTASSPPGCGSTVTSMPIVRRPRPWAGFVCTRRRSRHAERRGGGAVDAYADRAARGQERAAEHARSGRRAGPRGRWPERVRRRACGGAQPCGQGVEARSRAAVRAGSAPSPTARCAAACHW